MSEEKYNLEDVKAWALYEIGIEGEGFIYRQDERAVCYDGSLGAVDCYYYIDGEPSCIVGRMLHRQGIINKAMASEFEHAPVRRLIDRVAPSQFTESAQRFLGHLQGNQDEGRTWGESFELAFKRAQP